MSLPFFYEPAILESKQQFVLSEATSKHCIQVLRMKVNQALHLTDGKGKLFTANIISADKQKSVVQIENVKQLPAPEIQISIGISLLKNADRIEWMLEKITEIGIGHIYPLICKRTEHQRFRFERMQQILIAAMLQSQQTWLPVLHEPIELKKLLATADNEQKLIAHCEDNQKHPISTLAPAKDTLILIGPEGDFTPDEISMAAEKQFTPVTLGNTRLRTETAGVVSVALLANR